VPGDRGSFLADPDLQAYDTKLYAGCLHPDGWTSIGFDSTVVAVAPGRAVEARIRRAPAACGTDPDKR